MKTTKKSTMKKRIALVSQPAAKGSITRTSHATVNGTTSFLVKHTELLGAVTSGPGGVGKVSLYQIQPTSSSTFPWLSQIADRFEKYAFESLEFTYTTTSSTSSKGVVCMAIDYDPDDTSVPTGDQDGRMELMAHEGAVQSPVWQNVSVRVSPAQLRTVKERFLRNWSGEASVEPRTADVGNLFVGVFGLEPNSGATSGVWVGDLRVSYQVKLLIPQLNRPEEQSGPSVVSISTVMEDGHEDGYTEALAPSNPFIPTGSFLGNGGSLEVEEVGPPIISFESVVDSDGNIPVNVVKFNDSAEGTLTFERDIIDRGLNAPENVPWESSAGEAVGYLLRKGEKADCSPIESGDTLTGSFIGCEASDLASNLSNSIFREAWKQYDNVFVRTFWEPKVTDHRVEDDGSYTRRWTEVTQVLGNFAKNTAYNLGTRLAKTLFTDALRIIFQPRTAFMGSPLVYLRALRPSVRHKALSNEELKKRFLTPSQPRIAKSGSKPIKRGLV